MITIRKLSKSYKDNSCNQPVFQGLSYKFNSEGVYSILGSSGSGKTTLLNLISGLDDYESGTIKVFNQELSKLSIEGKSELRKKYFGFGYQFHYLLENLSIYENCLAANFGIDNGNIEPTLKKLGITNIKNKLPSKVSGGEKQRASIARAISKKPNVLILDEPTGNLDQQNSLVVQDFLLNYAKENKSLVIYATHDVAFAKKADKSLNIIEHNIVEE
ncbi:MAG: ABC transporter ATP-binding protein [Gammaproteobacteria bacterium TMED112]|nr:MAG: ABC transporter ATP-binding protein [Gammaproteobacteria bacterium TMED112]|tara:strand:- start:10101 stop:10751 length:651 start_codon:yes stop_codon:yes gene_type:complete